MRGLFLVLSILLPFAYGQTVDPELVAKLRAAPSHPDRIALLRDDQFVFNFLGNVGVVSGFSGHVVAATSANFPAVIGNGIAMALGYLEPCGLNTPHVHPRATEINIAVNGTLRTGMLAENNARFVFNNVPAGSVTVFPQGAIHFEMNMDCQPMVFVAGFNHEDPGASAVAQRLFGLPIDIVAASLDSLGVVEIAGLESKIPNNVAQGVAECLARCGLQRATNQPKSQRQPRLPSNPLPSGFSGPPPPQPPPTATTRAGAIENSSPSSSGGSSNNNNNNSNSISRTGGASVWDDNQARSFFIALLLINGLFVVGALAALFMYVARTRRGRSVAPPPHEFAPLSHKEEYYDPYGHPASPAPEGPTQHHE